MPFEKLKGKTKLWLSLVMNIPTIYMILVVFYGQLGDLSPIVENILFGMPVAMLLYIGVIYNYPLSLIFGFGEGKPFIGEDGFIMPQTVSIAFMVLLFYLVFFYFILSLKIWKRSDR